MILALVFSAFAADPAVTPADPAAPPVVDPCIVVAPTQPPTATDPALSPIPATPNPVAVTVAPPANCPAVDPASAPPANAKKKPLKPSKGNRMEAESKDE